MTTITTTATYEVIATDPIEATLVKAVSFAWETMWKPWNALLETKFVYVGYVGYLAVLLVGFTASLAYYGYTKVKGYIIK